MQNTSVYHWVNTYTSLKSVFFSWSVFFPQATEYTIGAYGKFNAGVPDTGGNGKLPPVSLTPGQIWHRHQEHQRYRWKNLPPVFLKPVENWSPV